MLDGPPSGVFLFTRDRSGRGTVIYGHGVTSGAVCCRFITVPGVGPITAFAFKTAVEVPERFAKSKTVGAHFGLTPRKYDSGQIDHQGHIRKCGDGAL